MAEVASAHVTIYPKIAPGFTQQMSGQFDGAGAKSGTSMGRIFSANFAANLAASGIAKAAGGIWSAIKGSFKGGFDRLMNIEQAEIKLKTLGINVEQAMGSVDEAVSGTRFAISDAADMAAFLGASGVDAGEDMTKWLKLTADAAQFMNLDFADAQSIIGTVAAQGRVTGEELNRLPVAAAALADHLGLPQQEIRKLASQGKISAEDFAEALNSKIGGAASNAGESFTAMVANIKTALNATSANLMAPMIEAIKQVLPVTFEIVKGVRDIAKPIGQLAGVVLAPFAAGLAAALGTIPPVLQSIGGALSSVVENGIPLGPVGDAIAAGFGEIRAAGGDVYSFFAASDFAHVITQALGIGENHPVSRFLVDFQTLGARVSEAFLAAMGEAQAFQGDWYGFFAASDFATVVAQALGVGENHPVARFLVAFQTLGAQVGDYLLEVPAIVGGIIEQVKTIVFGMGEALVAGFAPSLAPIKASLSELGFSFDGLVPVLAGLIGTVMQVAQSFSPLSLVFQALQPVLPQIAGLVGQLAGAAAELLAGLLPLGQQLAGVLIGAMTQLAVAIVPLVAQFATQLIPVVLRLAADIIPILMQVIQSLAPVIMQIAAAVVPLLTAALNAVLPVVSALATIFSAVLVPLLRSVIIPVVMLVVQAFASHLVGALQGAQRFISGLVTMVGALFRGDWAAAWRGAKDLVVGAIQAIWHTINLIWLGRVVGMVRGGLTSIVTLFRSGWSNAVQLLRQAWANIASAASGGAARLGSLVTGLVQRVLGFFRNMGSGMGSIIRNAWQVARSVFGGATAAIRTLVSQFVGAIRGFFVQLGTNMRSLASSGLQAVRGIFSRGMDALRTAVSGGRDRIVGLFRDMPGAFKRALGNLGGFLKDSGRALLDGFKGGIAAGFDKVKQAAKDGLKRVRDLFPFSPAREGPFSGRGYTSYSGQALARDFGAGITSQTAHVRRSAEALMNAAKVDTTLATITGTTAHHTGTIGAGAALAGGQYTFNITMNPRDLDQLRTLDDLIRTGRNTARRQGVLA